MSIVSAPRLAPLARSTPSLRAAATVAEDRAMERARIRWRMAAIAAEATSMLEARDLITRLFAAEGVTFFALPSMKTLRRWRARWLAGDRQIADFRDEDRTGRPRLRLAGPVARLLAEHVEAPVESSVRHLALAARDAMRSFGEVAPSRHTLARRLAVRHLDRVAARYGWRAAEIEALVHGTYPVDLVHEVWQLDEVTLPVWAHQWDDVARCYVSIRCEAVLVIDYCSRVILALHVCDPGRRRDANGRRRRGGFVREDALAALLSAAIPEIAEPAGCAPFGGYLPKTLMWDNAQQHRSLRAGKDENDVRLEFDPLTNVMEVPELPAGRPINRGLVERAIQTIKALCLGMSAHADRVVPADRVRVLPTAKRALAVAGGAREHRREVVPVEMLPTVAELRKELAVRVDRYNLAHEHAALGGRTPATAYRDHRNRNAADGRNLLAILPERTSTVSKEGIVIQREQVRHAFAVETDAYRLKVGRDVTYRPDPLFRALFAQVDGRPAVMRRKIDQARRTKAQSLAQEQREAAVTASVFGADALSEGVVAAMVRTAQRRTVEKLAEDIAEGRLAPMHGGVPSQPPAAQPAPTPEERLAADGRPSPKRPRLPGSRGFGPSLDEHPVDDTA